MNYDELFIDASSLPKPLSKQETYELLKEIKNGNEVAKEKLIKHNIRLVLYEVTNKFQNIKYEKKDLVSVGILGLIQSILSFDTSKNLSFSTYAVKCIDNKIIDFLRTIKQDKKCISLYSLIKQESSKNQGTTLIDILPSTSDIVEEYLDKEVKDIILTMLETNSDRNKKIIKMYFGLDDNIKCTQKEIATNLNISRQTVSAVVIKFLKEVKNNLENVEIIKTK